MLREKARLNRPLSRVESSLGHNENMSPHCSPPSSVSGEKRVYNHVDRKDVFTYGGNEELSYRPEMMTQQNEKFRKPGPCQLERHDTTLLRASLKGVLPSEEHDAFINCVFEMFPDFSQGHPSFKDLIDIVSGGALYIFFCRSARLNHDAESSVIQL